MTLLRMLAFRPEAAGQGAAATRAVPAPPTTPSQPAAPAPAAIPNAAAAAAAPVSDWSTVLAALDLDGPTRMLALNCTLAASRPGLIRLTLDARNAGARTRAREDKLAQALSRHLGEPVRIEIEVGEVATETPAQAGERATQEALAAARAALATDPTAQALQQRFAATINPDSVRARKPA
jgi:DNA polymerase-3 subunit gamma/tau